MWVDDGGSRRLLAPCTLVVTASGATLALAATSAVDRAGPGTLLVGTDLRGGAVRVVGQRLSRYVAVTLLELAPSRWPTDDVSPIALERLGTLRASSAAHFAIGIEQRDSECVRHTVDLALHERTFATRGGSGDDVTMVLATCDTQVPATWLFEGSPIVARHAASRLFGTPAEDRLIALTYTAGSPMIVGSEGESSWAELAPIAVR